MKGRGVLGDLGILNDLWINVYEPFFDIIYFKYYRNELELLNLLLRWASSNGLFTFSMKDFIVYSRVFCTHKRYVRAGRKRREFGDITFLVLFSCRDKRVGYANTFQLKVGLDLPSLFEKN